MECRVFSYSCSGLTWYTKEPFDSQESLHSVICHTMNTLKLYLVFLFSSRTLSCLVHLCVSRMLSYSLPFPQFLSFTEAYERVGRRVQTCQHIWGTWVFHTLKGALIHLFMHWNLIMSYFCIFGGFLLLFLIGQKKATCVHPQLSLLCNIQIFSPKMIRIW